MIRADANGGGWTALDLIERFGPLPLWRLRMDPAPGTATERDVVEIHDREDLLYELVDGVLIEKTMGALDSALAVWISHLLWSFVEPRRLGLVLGADGMLRLSPGLVRIPDVSFVSWSRLREEMLQGPWLDVPPDLAIEVLSPWNTQREMERKLAEHFAAGVRQVWHVDGRDKTVTVFHPKSEPCVLGADRVLDGKDVLPGLSLRVADLLTLPNRPDV